MNALSHWWRTRNDPPPMLPDPVTWTVHVDPELAEAHIRTTVNAEKWESWTVSEDFSTFSRPMVAIRYRRTDGAYRWRDDGFRGY